MPVNPFAFQQYIMPTPQVGAAGGGEGIPALSQLGADLRHQKISQGYLDLQKQQLERSQQNDAIELMSKERDKRQAAIDAWLSAVRSGNRADVWTLGKRLQGMGVNVQMPSSFVAAGPPEGEAPTMPQAEPDEPNFSLETRKPGEAGLAKQLDRVQAETVAELAPSQPPSPSPPAGPVPFNPTRPDGTPIAAGIAQGALQGIQPVQMGGALMGPGGMPTPQPPPQTWRVNDPVTGTNLEITPEDILSDQEREIDQAFLPLVKMEGLDPIAARAYQVGHEYAKGQLGFMTPKDAADKGMAVAKNYMEYMNRKSAIDTKEKPKGGGGQGGHAFAAPGTARSLQLVGGLTDNVTSIIAKTKQSEGYLKNVEAQNTGNMTLSKLSMNMGVGDRGAVGDYIKSISGAAATDQERAWYTGAAGFWSSLTNKANYVANGGKLDEQLISELRQMIEKANGILANRQQQILQKGWGATKAQIDLWLGEAGITDEKRRMQYYNAARGELGLPQTRKKQTGEQSADDVARGL